MLKEMPETAVQCRTKVEYDRVLSLFTEAGWEWAGGGIASKHSFWGMADEEGRCIRIGNAFNNSNARYYREAGVKIISFSEFLAAQGIEEELKVGDWVEVIREHDGNGSLFHYPAGARYQICQVDSQEQIWIIDPRYDRNDQHKVVVCTHIRDFRKCSPPVEKTRSVTEGEDYCSKPPKEAFWATALPCFEPSYIILPPNRPDLVERAKQIFSPTSSPIPSMSTMDNAVKAYRNSKLNPVERKLRKAGFRDDNGNWTDKAVRTFIEMKLDEEGHKALEPIAKAVLKAQKDEDCDECDDE